MLVLVLAQAMMQRLRMLMLHPVTAVLGREVTRQFSPSRRGGVEKDVRCCVVCLEGPSFRVFPLGARIPRARGSSGATATVPFVWRGHTKTPTTRAGRALDIAVWLE